ncbi:EamA/RhaT family transporter [Pseudorhizobium endolithicum]|uniref:EamA/RhaT family transporter n=1 Tax=Pseudorhizobium endolithicum TaxID=1191678 RepID=A0ABN7JK98_9HYPH|nr:EamA/RhaT family transporter [Pseudorhizobium endolithicum]
MANSTIASTDAQRHPLLWPMLATLMIIGWSSSFVGIRYASEEASAMLLLFWRTLVSGLILLPFALAIGPKISLCAIRDQALFGLMAVFIYLGGFSLAIEQGVPTGLVALIADLLPLAIVALSQPVLGEKLTARQWLGTIIAVLGVVIVSFDSIAVGTAPLWAYALTVVSMLVFAVASVVHRKRRATSMPVHQSLCIHSLTGSVLFGICAWSAPRFAGHVG